MNKEPKKEKLAELITRGPWQIPVKVSSCLCEDGNRRVAVLTKEADTFFSIPAKVKVKGKTVTGFVTRIETDGKEDYKFIVFKNRKNAYLLEQNL